MSDRPTEPDVEELRDALNVLGPITTSQSALWKAARCWLAHVEAREAAQADDETRGPDYGPFGASGEPWD